MVILIIISILGFLCLFFNEVEDECVRSTFKKNKQFWNLNESSNNKWKLDKDGNLIPITKKSWKYLWLWTPKYVEKFYLSSTILVFLTDGEHLMQFCKFRMIEIALLLIGWQYVVAWIIGKSISQLVKELINWIK